MVSAMSERLSRVKPARYMTPKVPIRDTGTATSGTMAARALRRNMNTDSTTSATEIASARSTSWSDARMVGVRSMYTLREVLAGMVARRCGSSARTRSEEHTSELQSRLHLVCRLLLGKKDHHTQPR